MYRSTYSLLLLYCTCIICTYTYCKNYVIYRCACIMVIHVHVHPYTLQGVDISVTIPVPDSTCSSILLYLQNRPQPVVREWERVRDTYIN